MIWGRQAASHHIRQLGSDSMQHHSRSLQLPSCRASWTLAGLHPVSAGCRGPLTSQIHCEDPPAREVIRELADAGACPTQVICVGRCPVPVCRCPDKTCRCPELRCRCNAEGQRYSVPDTVSQQHSAPGLCFLCMSAMFVC